jgi:3-phosphoshikimate 1-carboxyvinyltransferase
MNPQRPTVARRPLDTIVQAVPSKSVTHRALILAALADGASVIEGPLDADDTRVTLNGLASLGFATRVEPGRWHVEGRGGTVPGGGTLALGDSGTSARFLLALSALGRSPSTLDGSARLRQRPMGVLLDALTGCGARIEPASARGLPLRVGGLPLRGGRTTLPSGPSSQFASALLLIGPRLPGGIDLTLEPPVASQPYVEVTAAVMDHFGVGIERPSPLRWCVPAGRYEGRVYRIEGDHSSASYFLAAPAITGGRVRVEGLDPRSAQPDRRLGEILEGLGCAVSRGKDWIEVRGGEPLAGFDLDLNDAPDLVPTLAVIALFADGPTRLRGIAHLRVKESDRLETVAANLRALGRPARACEDRLEIDAGDGPLRGAKIATASDHRIAMAFALAGLRVEDVELDDPSCVAKSNPGFWAQYGRLAR